MSLVFSLSRLKICIFAENFKKCQKSKLHFSDTPEANIMPLTLLPHIGKTVPMMNTENHLWGGGSVFFSKPKSKYNIINDIDIELITTYRIIQDKEMRNKLLEMISKEVATKERWREVFEFVPSNELEMAFKYFYLNRTSFSGKLSSPAWGYREKRSLPPDRWHERIIPCGEMLKDVIIENQDFESIINQPAKGKNVLMFVDPPYFKPSKKKHYRNGFDLNDHIRLANCLKETTHKFILTYEDAPEIRELYSWAIINGMEFSYRVDNSVINNGNRNKGVELIITNYEITQPSLFDLEK